MTDAKRVLLPREAIDWLYGVGPDHEGHHFGEGDYPKKGTFWWRTRFREMCKVLTGSISPFDAASPNTGCVSEEDFAIALSSFNSAMDLLARDDPEATYETAMGVGLRAALSSLGLEVG